MCDIAFLINCIVYMPPAASPQVQLTVLVVLMVYHNMVAASQHTQTHSHKHIQYRTTKYSISLLLLLDCNHVGQERVQLALGACSRAASLQD